MGRMKNEHKTIVDWKLSLTYKCPVTGELVNNEITEDITANESPCDLCGSHGEIYISLGKCSSCGKYHDSIEINTW